MKVYIKTFGCTMNKADTELMQCLISEKHSIVESEDACDIAIVNSCCVIKRSEINAIREVERLKNKNKKVILAGCLAEFKPEIAGKIAHACISPGKISEINKLLDNEKNNGSKKDKISSDDKDKAMLLKEHALIKPPEKSVEACIPIAEGCLGNCSYCATKFARGRLRSFDADAIKELAEKYIAMGYREIQLTAQDTACYGFDFDRKNVKLPDLIKNVASISRDFRIRVGMMNPGFAKMIMKELINAYKSEKVYKFLHLPLQSGDDEILKAMKRGYKVEDFLNIVERFRKAFPELNLSTDIIVGFPSESESSFEKTLKLIEKVKPDMINIKRYSRREKTEAAKLKDMPDRIKKERSRILSKLLEEIALKKNEKYVSKVERALITEKGKDNTLIARLNNYKQAVIENSSESGKKAKPGDFVDVEIKEARSFYLIAEIVA